MAKKKVAAVKKTAAKTATKAVAVKKKPASKAAAKTAVKTAAKSTKKIAVKKTALKSKTVKPAASKSKAAKPATKATPLKAKGPVELLADKIVEGILEVKGRNISILDLRDIHNRVCDYFIICQADSNTQVNAIAGSVEEMVKKATGERPYRKEGFENSEWILVDYVTVVVHVFQTEVRNFYNLESLWADAEVTQIAFDK